MADMAMPLEDVAALTNRSSEITPRPTRPSLTSPFTLKTSEAGADHSTHDSPTTHQTDQTNSTPAHSSSLRPQTTSPKAERLPSFRQLSKIADAAGDEVASRPSAYPLPPQTVYPPPPGSNHSPVLPHQPYPQTVQMSPSQTFAYVQNTSPVTLHNEVYYSHSPPSAFPVAHGSIYHPRRQSMTAASNAPPPLLHSTLTGSSIESYSHSHHSSAGEGHSTTQTTPIEPGPVDATGRPKFPLLPPTQVSTTHSSQGPWYCDQPNCTASPFPTQYLLNSHATSHSSSRPHYCLIAGCPRSQGGKGFKRKNEMIRHGLTHDTPGYICPFCPDRGHKYPRPDNLQRHVRVHHIDKDRDDPLLREVLSQRTPGHGVSGRGRRRRTGP